MVCFCRFAVRSGRDHQAAVRPDPLNAVQWCVFVGSQCVVAGTTKLPYGQIPLMLYNGVFYRFAVRSGRDHQAAVRPDPLNAVQWCVFVGSQCVVAGTTKLPYGQIPLMLYNGVFYRFAVRSGRDHQAAVRPDPLNAVQWCVFVGSQCVVAGTTKLPYGQIPLMLYNGVFL